MLVTSRSFDEYVAMFDLSPSDFAGSILDCSAGVAGFAAAAGERGTRVVAVDPAYGLAGTELARLGNEDLARGNAIASDYPDRFTFAWYGTPERRLALRKGALAQFLVDRVANPGRYVAGQLPQLPFDDGAFDLAVCSHLLFTWAEQLGQEWHRAALVELARVAREVRVFPTVMMGPGEPVPFWDELMAALAATGYRCELREVPYEFQAGANQMLVLSH